MELYDWHGLISKSYRVFIITDRWAIRQHTVRKYRSVVLHRCDDGGCGNIHDLYIHSNCVDCKTLIPDEVQALWFLQNLDNDND